MANNRKATFIGMLLFLLMMIGTLSFADSPFKNATAQEENILISEVYYNTHVSYEPDEYVALSNPLNDSVDISGWKIGTDTSKAIFPEQTTIEAGDTIYVVREADVILEQNTLNGILPDFEYSDDTVSSIPNMLGSNPRFANNSDEVILEDDSGTLIDIVVYGDSSYDDEGWIGEPVPKGSSGDILRRNQVEGTNQWIDTDARLDWDSLKTNPLAVSEDFRTYKQGQSNFEIEDFTFNGQVRPYTSPDSTYGVLNDLINNAEHSIDLSVYEMQSPQLTQSLVDAINRGVEVRAYFDGAPVGGLQDHSRWVSQQIHDAGGEVRYLILDRGENSHKRYRWDHSKYGIVDGDTLFVQSENWKKTGTPVDNSNGNRGWGIVIENADVASYFQNVFDTDWDDSFPDIFPHTPSHGTYGDPPSSFEPDTATIPGNYPAPFTSEPITGEFTVTPVIAPDTSFMQDDSIIGMIKEAEDYVYVDQMYIHKHWGSADDNPQTHPNIYLEAVIDAARSGATVRVNLGDAWLDSSNSRDNTHTVDYINEIANNENLDMEAHIMDTESIGNRITHNKGVIADDKVLISSINWSKNSGENNREAGVIVQSQDVADYYKDVFEYDWNGGDNVLSQIFEDFEGTTKTTYSAGNVILNSGSWYFDDALLGTLENDKKNGEQSARIRAGGSITMDFDVSNVQTVSFYHANYGYDTGGEITLQKSTDEGTNWVNVDSSFTSSDSLTKKEFVINESNDVRFRIEVSGNSGTRINIDNFDITNEPILDEEFEGVTKGNYAPATVNLNSGTWFFDNALLGAHSSDKSFGVRSARILSNGSIAMDFDVDNARNVSFYHANFGSDDGAEITLQKSTDQGANWTDIEGSFTSQNELEKITVSVNETNGVRFRIKISGQLGARINIDNFKIFK